MHGGGGVGGVEPNKKQTVRNSYFEISLFDL